jgi:hypothetical protein
MKKDMNKTVMPEKSPSSTNVSTLCYECVEPDLGEDLYLLDLSDTDPDIRRKLENHIQICDACRFEYDVKQNVEDGFRTGRYTIPTHGGWLGSLCRFLSPPGQESWAGATQTMSTIAFAVCVLLIFILPPSTPSFGSGQRGPAEAPRFERPVEGEVVLDANPTLSWRPIEEASGYKITLDNVGGGYEWDGQTRDNTITVPSESPVPIDDRMRAILEPIPSDLAPAGGYSLSFRRGSLLDFLGYRIAAAPLLLKIFGSLALVSMVTALAIITKR